MRILFLIAGCLLSIGAVAQSTPLFMKDEYDPQTFYGGLTAGVNFSQVDGDLRSGYYRVGLVAGPAVHVRLSGRLFASMELLFSQKGTRDRSIRDNPATGPGVAEYDLRLNYAEVPVSVLLHYQARWMIGAGVTYGRLISSKESAWENGPINLYPEINYFRRDDWEWHAILNWEFARAWVASMRFNYSLRTIRDPQRIPAGFGGGDSYAQFNNVYSLRLCYFFNKKPKY